jgi:hypothetical protein
MAQATAPVLDSTRRDFITLVGGAASWPLAARGQQPRRVGVLIANYAQIDREGSSRRSSTRSRSWAGSMAAMSGSSIAGARAIPTVRRRRRQNWSVQRRMRLWSRPLQPWPSFTG